MFCAVGGHSAAFWLRSGDTAPGAFDDAADFGRNDLIRLARSHGRKPWGRARLWLDGGTADPFRAADERLAAALHIHMRHWAGGHDGAYWQRHYKRYLRFYADALGAC
jgi:enterochelin esterase-like enzyme